MARPELTRLRRRLWTSAIVLAVVALIAAFIDTRIALSVLPFIAVAATFAAISEVMLRRDGA
jgi:hypothetical protein